MTVGPIIIFDKSTLESLKVDEGVWLDSFYRANITPLFFVETLADLEKRIRDGRTPEQVVGNLAQKTPVRGSLPNLHHRTLAVGEMLGRQRVQMSHFPVIPPGRAVVSGGHRGIVYDEMPEFEAFKRWQQGDFLEIERRFAREWRGMLSGLNLGAIAEQHRRPKGMKLRDQAHAKLEADRLVATGSQYGLLQAVFGSLAVPANLQRAILGRWRGLGEPALREFAPYTTHIATVDLFFNLALGSDLISRNRPSNKIDIAYLYYLPFCMVFSSNDKLHKKAAPCFLRANQTFLPGEELKADLARLDAHFARLPPSVLERGVMSFVYDPPVEGDFLVARLWDQFLPEWRGRRGRRPELTAEANQRLVEKLKRMRDGQPDTTDPPVTVDAADFVHFRRLVPMHVGKWRILPPEVARRIETDGE